MADDKKRYGLSKPTRDDILRSGFSTPWDAPMVPPFPFTFRNVEVMTVYYRTDPEAMKFLAPEPVEAKGDVVAIHIYKMNDTEWLGPYSEANVMFGAEMPGVAEGGYSPYLFLSSDVGVAHGREAHGQPKKGGQPNIEFRQDLIVGTVARNGIDVVTATMPYKQHRADPGDLAPYFDFKVNLNLKVIDHITGAPAIRQITSRKLTDVKIHECWAGPCTVELRPNAQAPVYRLPVIDTLQGFFWRADFTLVEGEIIHDYLVE